MTLTSTAGDKRVRGRAALFIAVAGSAACLGAAANCASNSSAGPPTPTDASTPSDARDGGPSTDSDAEASTDAPTTCTYASPDAQAADSTWSGWHHIPQLDSCCAASVPDDLQTTVAPLTWDPCGDASDGCLDFHALARAPQPYLPVAIVTRDAAGAASSLEVFQAVSADLSTFDAYVYDLSSGMGVAAWRWDAAFSPCHVFDLTLGNDSLSLLVRTSNQTLGVASGTPASVMTNPSFRSLAGFEQVSAVQDTATSSSVFAFDIAPAGNVYRTTIDSGSVQTTLGKQTGESLFLSFVEGSDVFAVSDHGTVGYAQLYTVAADGSPVLLRGFPDHDVSALATDGHSLIWTETYASNDGGSSMLQFWSAPYTTDPVALASTAVQVGSAQGVLTPSQAIAFGGIYSVYAGGSGQLVVRVADGHVLNLQPPTGYDFWKAAYVSNTELWIGLSITSGPRAVGLRRIPLGTW
jgi:hypothetical protein